MWKQIFAPFYFWGFFFKLLHLFPVFVNKWLLTLVGSPHICWMLDFHHSWETLWFNCVTSGDREYFVLAPGTCHAAWWGWSKPWGGRGQWEGGPWDQMPALNSQERLLVAAWCLGAPGMGQCLVSPTWCPQPGICGHWGWGIAWCPQPGVCGPQGWGSALPRTPSCPHCPSQGWLCPMHVPCDRLCPSLPFLGVAVAHWPPLSRLGCWNPCRNVKKETKKRPKDENIDFFLNGSGVPHRQNA